MNIKLAVSHLSQQYKHCVWMHVCVTTYTYVSIIYMYFRNKNTYKSKTNNYHIKNVES